MPVHRHPIAVSTGKDSLSNVPLDLALIDRLRSSFDLIRASGLRLAEIFYTKLFEAAPQLRPLFRSDLQAQSEKLIASLDAIVQNLTKPEDNAASLAALGKRHADYGAKPEHYDLVIETLIDSMGEILGSSADQRSLDEWRMALRLVGNQMMAAAKAASTE